MNYRTLLKISAVLALVSANSTQASVHIFSCEPEWAALSTELGGDLITVFSATNALQDPHYIQARPSLIAKVRKADLLICSGSGLEAGWLPLLLRKGNNPAIQPGRLGNLMASEFVTRLEVPTSLDRSQGDQHAMGNPHIQSDPRNMTLVARVITQRLQQLDPDNASTYTTRLAVFEQEWSEAIIRWQQQAAPLRDKNIVLHHKSWAYLINWLGLKEVATLESKPGVPPSAAHLENLLARLKASPAAIIIRTPYQDSKPSQWLSNKTGIPNTTLPFTVGGSPDATNLFSLFDSTISILLEKMVTSNEQHH